MLDKHFKNYLTDIVFISNKKQNIRKGMLKTMYTYKYCSLNNIKRRSKYLALEPGSRKNISVIESYTT